MNEGRASGSDVGAARRSLGGTVVERSLAEVGYQPRNSVSLIETSGPHLGRLDTVLVQNAWNFIPNEEFQELSASYPVTMRSRMVARRLVAQFNVRRARRVVALSEAMANLVHQSTLASVQVSPVTLPLDTFTAQPDPPAKAGYVLVPGTITWFKNPVRALLWAREYAPDHRVFFAGRDDGSGCLQELRATGEGLGMNLETRTLTREEMSGALIGASAVVLPSRLESLGFSMSEALVLASGTVVATALPSHLELATRLGREPRWLDTPHEESTGSTSEPAKLTRARVAEEWHRLRELLDARSTEVAG